MSEAPDATTAGTEAPASTVRGNNPVRRWVSRALAAVGVGVTVWIAVRNPDNLTALVEAEPTAIALLVLLQLLLLLSTAVTHRFVVHEVSGVKVALGPWTTLFITARFLSNVAPQAGNAYRAARLRTEWGVSLTHYVSAFLAFMWLLTTYNFVLAVGVVAIFQPWLRIAGLPAVLLLSVGSVGLAVGPLAARALWRTVPALKGRLGWVRERLQLLLDAFVEAFAHPGTIARGLVLTTMQTALATAVTWSAFRALEHRLSLSEVLVFYVIIQLGSFIQVTPGNIGVQELAFGVLATEYNVPAAAGIIVSALIRVTGLVALFLLAVPMGGIKVARRWRSASPPESPPVAPGPVDDDQEPAPRPPTEA